MTKLNIIFAGTPAFGLPCLEALLSSKHNVIGVYTQPDRPAGRGRKLQASEVKIFAEKHNLPVYQPLNFKSQEAIDELAALKPDLMLVIAYGLILPQKVLDIPKYGCINVHASILPHWRGASPIQQAILHGDKESGVTIMQMDAGMDTGDILQIETYTIKPEDTAGDLHDALAGLAAKPLLNILDKVETLNHIAIKQDSTQKSLAPKIKKEEAAINWTLPAVNIDRQIRAFNPWPIAYTHFGIDTLRIYKAYPVKNSEPHAPGTVLSLDKLGILVKTSLDALMIEIIQFPGKKPMSVADWLNAHQGQLKVGTLLT